MPKYNNKFATPKHIEETILDSDGRIIGKVRLKPSRILWKPAKHQEYFSVSLDDFAEWIISTNLASKTKS